MLLKVNDLKSRTHYWNSLKHYATVNLKEPTKVWHDLGPSWHTTFPHVFEYQYAHKSSRALGEKVLQHLLDQGIKARGVERDLDHGMSVLPLRF